MNLRHLIDFCDLSDAEWNTMYELGCDIMKSPEKYADACKGKILATLFYEPSTRTQLSFQTAMLKLGGSVIGFSDPNTSSVTKGESLRDTVKIISTYADIVVMRNPIEGAAYAASLYSSVPVINAGDGGHLHPTQTMADIFTITKKKGTCDNLNVGFCGDLLNGRTVHSLISALINRKNNRLWLISTDTLRVPSYVIEKLNASGVEYHVVDTLEECISELDVLYMTRIQRERFASKEEYESQSGIYVLDDKKMKMAKDDMIVLHPLPKVDEITYEVDDDPRACYFEQAKNGLYIRMALILMLCEANRAKFTDIPVYDLSRHNSCRNPKCVTKFEKYLPEKIKTNGNKCLCEYCDGEI